VARAHSGGGAAPLEDVLAWIASTRDADADAVRARLRGWVPEYTPTPGKT
jgi:hypothetical protein